MTFEAHITIEPVFGEKFNLFEACCKPYQFRPAELLLQKTRVGTPQRSTRDSFCTGHGVEYGELLTKTKHLVEDLRACGFSVWRYKIEEILIDVRTPPLIALMGVKS